jgi:Uma2 family endonuclease
LATFGVQDPIKLADSEPEPDFTVLTLRADDYASGKPESDDIYLVVEVADSSLDYDRDDKGPIYAENGIAEYWIVNLIDRCVEVYRDPQPDGKYVSVQILQAGESITLSKLPSVTVAVADILP